MSNVLSGNWLVRKPARGRCRLRLFCFPHAGVGASAYRLWPAGLPSELEVCAVQTPGRESRLREPPYTHVESLVEAALEALQPALDLPFAFFGHSMGAVVAGALTVALGRRGGPLPAHLFLSGHRAPHLPDPEPLVGGLADDLFVTEINRRYGGIPPEILQERELMELLLPGLRADIRALESYRPTTALHLGCPVSVFGGTEDRRATRGQLEAWREGATGAFHVNMFPGGHFYLDSCRPTVLAKVVATLAPIIESANAPVPTHGHPLAWGRS
jgi:medium-chain acyl-[acyl-carrier-protein] hydrolase